MGLFIILIILCVIAACILLLVGTIMYLVKAVKENSGKAPQTSKKSPIVVISIGLFFYAVIFLLVLLAVGAVLTV